MKRNKDGEPNLKRQFIWNEIIPWQAQLLSLISGVRQVLLDMFRALQSELKLWS